MMVPPPIVGGRGEVYKEYTGQKIPCVRWYLRQSLVVGVKYSRNEHAGASSAPAPRLILGAEYQVHQRLIPYTLDFFYRLLLLV